MVKEVYDLLHNGGDLANAYFYRKLWRLKVLSKVKGFVENGA